MNHDLSENGSLFTQNSSIQKLCPVRPDLADYWVQCWIEHLVFTGWTIAHCSGCVVEPACVWQDYQVRCPQWCTTPASTKQSRERPWLVRSRLDTGSVSSVWGAGWEDSRRREILKSFTSRLYKSPTPNSHLSVWADFHPQGEQKEKCVHFAVCDGYLNIKICFMR